MRTLEEKHQIFYNWLVGQGVLFNYLKYIKFEWLNNENMTDYLRFRFIQLANSRKTLIGWIQTEEGFEYWDDLDDKWRDYLKDNNIE